MSFFNNFKKKNLIAAHRGYSKKFPENTMSAFENSIGKSDLIELDVQFTKDNIPIVFHDENLLRTSDVTDFEEFAHRKPYNICDFDYDELLKLDFGSWFSKNKLPKKEKIVTLDEVLKFAANNDIVLNLEIKDIGSSLPIVDIVYLYIKNNSFEDKVLISSFNHEYLKAFKKLDPSISTAALVSKFHPDNLVSYLKELAVCAYHIDNETVTQELVEKLNKEDIFVNVYTANLKRRKKELFSWGVKMVFTDCL